MITIIYACNHNGKYDCPREELTTEEQVIYLNAIDALDFYVKCTSAVTNLYTLHPELCIDIDYYDRYLDTINHINNINYEEKEETLEYARDRQFKYIGSGR
jgi:transcription elongation factor Elf1